MLDKSVAVVDAFKQHWPESYDPLMLPLRILLFQAHALHESGTTRVLADRGLSLVEFSALSSLRRSPAPYAMTPSEIQQSMLITSGGLTKVLMQLEERGLVTRPVHDGDRRIKPVALTEKAINLMDETMAEVHQRVFGWFSRSLKRDEIEQLAKLLAKLTGTNFVE
jgi:DNA-binding MarR family transcriptional regulator